VEANVLISEVGDYLIKTPPDGHTDFIVIWRYSPFHKTFNYSIRCKEGGPDLSLIAKKFGGGGHKQAAGFSTPNFLFG
jgi:oligoribonuclease NrnB/cAMP/cGMP phosphodiesterase (DHH superfamily)